MRGLIWIFSFASVLVLSTSCTSPQRKLHITTPEEPANYRAHPASYLVDRFPVRREIHRREESPLPFYYQRCSRTVGYFIGTNTAYDCN